MKQITTRLIFSVILIHTAGYHATTQSAAHKETEELLLEHTPQVELDKQLACATFEGDVEMVQKLLLEGADPNYINIYKQNMCNNRVTELFLDSEALRFTIKALFAVNALYVMTDAITKVNINYALIPNLIALLCYPVKGACNRCLHTKHSFCWKQKIIRATTNKTPLMIAAQQQKSQQPVGNQLIKLLLQHGAHVNDSNEDGNTALVFAAINNNIDAIEMLCLAGADILHLNTVGNRPLTIATREAENIMQTIQEIRQLKNIIKKNGLLWQFIPAPKIVHIIIDYILPHAYDTHSLTNEYLTHLIEDTTETHTPEHGNPTHLHRTISSNTNTNNLTPLDYIIDCKETLLENEFNTALVTNNAAATSH